MYRDQGQRRGELDQEITITGNVQAVAGRRVESQFCRGLLPVDRQARTGKCRAPQGRDVEPVAAVGQSAAIPVELLAVGQPVLGGLDRLRSLQVGVGRQDHSGVGLAAGDERPLQLQQQAVDRVDAVSDVELEVGGNLVVAAAGGVQLAAHVTQSFDQRRLDVHVHIFQLGAEREFSACDLLEDPVEFGDDRVSLVSSQQANLGQHSRMRLRTADVNRGQAMVKADRFGERLDARIGLAAETSTPGFLSHRPMSPCSNRFSSIPRMARTTNPL